MKNRTEFQEALNCSYKFLSARPRTEKEIIDKLKSKKYNNKIINEVVDNLKKINYINDYEFCLNWINYRLKLKPIGKKRLIWELKNKGVSYDLAVKTVEELISNEKEERITRDLFEKHLLKYKTKSNGINKLKKFLLRRGFSLEIIEKICKDNNF
jgi:regulatory protein